MTDFLVLSLSRSGSTWLCDMLHSHPEITCYGEIFVRKDRVPSQPRLQIDFDPQYVPWKFRNANFLAYLHHVKSQSPNRPHFGFKLMVRQNETVLRHLAGEKRWKVIYLLRNNDLAAYASRVALKSGADPAVGQPFDEDDFRRFYQGRAKRRAEAESIFLELGIEPLRIEYTDLFRSVTWERTLTFLDAASGATLTSAETKRGNSNIVGRFEHPDRVINYLSQIGREDWASESIDAPA